MAQPRQISERIDEVPYIFVPNRTVVKIVMIGGNQKGPKNTRKGAKTKNEKGAKTKNEKDENEKRQKAKRE